MAHKKGAGSTDNGRDSAPQYLGVKKFGGQHVVAGNILVTQRGTRFHPGINTYLGKDFTLHAAIEGVVCFRYGRNAKRVVYVSPVAEDGSLVFPPPVKSIKGTKTKLPSNVTTTQKIVRTTVVAKAKPAVEIVEERSVPVFEVPKVVKKHSEPVTATREVEAVVEHVEPEVHVESVVEHVAPEVHVEAVVEHVAPEVHVEAVVEHVAPEVHVEAVVEHVAPEVHVEAVVEHVAPEVHVEAFVEHVAPETVVEPVAEHTETTTVHTAETNAAVSAKDDLKKIEGIGPKIEQLLNEAGIHTFAQLAAADVEHVKEILHAAGSRYAIHNPATWTRQSALAAEGKWDELKTWQDALDGGKE